MCVILCDSLSVQKDGIGIKVSAILFHIQFCGSRPDKITHPHIQRGNGSHNRVPGHRDHKDHESGDNHLHCFGSGGQPHQVRQDRHQQEQSGKKVEDDGREADQEHHDPLDQRHGHDRRKHHDLRDQFKDEHF